uniref:Uncharacterized protein n=1 Tax=Amphimedon queenslandica TaxID=400682 RepID=A0A1X7ULF4_AMPQE
MAFPFPFSNYGGVFISCLEWTVFVCTHSIGSGWKNTAGIELPSIVKRIMRNGKC